jgi:hypothetical protein
MVSSKPWSKHHSAPARTRSVVRLDGGEVPVVDDREDAEETLEDVFDAAGNNKNETGSAAQRGASSLIRPRRTY